MYFGLQAGAVNAMPMQSALIAFTLFRSLQRRFPGLSPLSPPETTLVEVTAGAVGLAPFTSGFISFIPALEYLATAEEGGRLKFSSGQLLLWSVATCGLGIVVAVPFRRLFILKQRLRFPSATATGTLIGLLFKKDEITSQVRDGGSNTPVPRPRGTGDSRACEPTGARASSEIGTDLQHHDSPAGGVVSHAVGEATGSKEIGVLFISLAGSALFVRSFVKSHPHSRLANVNHSQGFISYFVPILRNVPLFGS
jgi:uncharacterized oligopeptide transporter (OPT) family protein